MAADDRARERTQQTLNEYFESPTAWEDLHYRKGLYETIYQQRWTAVLSLLDKAGLPPGSRILEIGCGPGVTTLGLAQRGHLVYAVDTVSSMIDSMRRLVGDAGLGNRVRGSLADINHLPFPDNSFAAVVVVGVLEWLDSWEQPFREIGRVMQPLGVFIGVANNVGALHRVLDPRLNPILQPMKVAVRSLQRRMNPMGGLLVEHFHSGRQARTALEKAGLRITSRTSVGFGPFSFLGLRLFRDPLGLRIHYRLQRWADSGVPVLRSMGFVQVFVVRKIAAAR